MFENVARYKILKLFHFILAHYIYIPQQMLFYTKYSLYVFKNYEKKYYIYTTYLTLDLTS
jgi:hypothetical protein